MNAEFFDGFSFNDDTKQLEVRGYGNKIDGTYRRDDVRSVIRQSFNDDGWNRRVTVCSCPCCNVSLSGYMCVPYCPNCGQHLSW